MSPKVKFGALLVLATIIVINVSRSAAAKDPNSLLGKLSTIGA